jgi:hypothetical protein
MNTRCVWRMLFSTCFFLNLTFKIEKIALPMVVSSLITSLVHLFLQSLQIFCAVMKSRQISSSRRRRPLASPFLIAKNLVFSRKGLLTKDLFLQKTATWSVLSAAHIVWFVRHSGHRRPFVALEWKVGTFLWYIVEEALQRSLCCCLKEKCYLHEEPLVSVSVNNDQQRTSMAYSSSFSFSSFRNLSCWGHCLRPPNP